MSTARGNVKKSGPPKYQNKSAFKNNLHDSSTRTKQINAIEVVGACARCTEVIEWKIRYKKYKPLTVPKKCTECCQKSVKRAYYLLCDSCVESTGRCGKCGKREEIMAKPGPSPAEAVRQQAELERDLKLLSERQRRTFFRLQTQGKLAADDPSLADDPPVEEDPSVEESSSVEDPSVEKSSSVEDPPVEEAPSVEESSSVEDPPVEDDPSVEESSSVEDPPVEDDPSVEESSSVEGPARAGATSPDHDHDLGDNENDSDDADSDT